MIEVLGVAGVVAGFGAVGIWLAISRGSWMRKEAEQAARAERIAAQLVVTAHDYAEYKRHVEQQLEAKEVTIDAYESMLAEDMGGDPRNLVAALGGVLPRGAGSANTPNSAGGVSADAGGTGHTAAGSELLGPRRGLLGSTDGEGDR